MFGAGFWDINIDARVTGFWSVNIGTGVTGFWDKMLMLDGN